MSGSNVLRQAKELLSDKNRWCQGAYARSEDGHVAPSWSHAGVKFCIYGAASKVLLSTNIPGSVTRFIHQAAMQLYSLDAISVNDGDEPRYGHPAVLKVLDLAIELAEAEEKP